MTILCSPVTPLQANIPCGNHLFHPPGCLHIPNIRKPSETLLIPYAPCLFLPVFKHISWRKEPLVLVLTSLMPTHSVIWTLFYLFRKLHYIKILYFTLFNLLGWHWLIKLHVSGVQFYITCVLYCVFTTPSQVSFHHHWRPAAFSRLY